MVVMDDTSSSLVIQLAKVADDVIFDIVIEHGVGRLFKSSEQNTW